MITYSMRYRGPMEYDKFALNILQFHNEIFGTTIQELQETNAERNSLLNQQKQLTSAFNSIVGEQGTSEKMYYHMLRY